MSIRDEFPEIVGQPLSKAQIDALRRVNTRDYRDLIATIDDLQKRCRENGTKGDT